MVKGQGQLCACADRTLCHFPCVHYLCSARLIDCSPIGNLQTWECYWSFHLTQFSNKFAQFINLIVKLSAWFLNLHAWSINQCAWLAIHQISNSSSFSHHGASVEATFHDKMINFKWQYWSQTTAMNSCLKTKKLAKCLGSHTETNTQTGF